MRLRPSRRLVDPFELEVDDVVLEDVARSLSRQCRYNGHVGGFLSVARHALWTSELAYLATGDWTVAYAALHHDDAEAYLSDVIRPLKERPEFDFYREIESEVEEVIFEALGVATPLADAVHEADDLAGYLERTVRMDFHGDPYRDEADWLRTHVIISRKLQQISTTKENHG